MLLRIALVFGTLVVQSGSLLAVDLPGIENIVLSDDGKLALLADGDGRVHLYDPIRKTHFRTVGALSGSKAATAALALWPDEELAAVSGEKTPVTIWSMKKGSSEKILSGRTPATRLAFSPDGKSLAGSLTDGRVVIWSGPDYKEEAALSDVHAVTALAWSNNGKLLALATQDSELIVWFPSTKKTLLKVKSPREVSKLAHLAFSPDGRTLFTAGQSQYALWDVAKGKLTASIDPKFEGTVNRSFGVAWNPGKNEAVDLTEKSFRVWNLAKGEIVRELPADLTPHDATFSRDGTKVLYREKLQLGSGSLVYRDLGAELDWPSGFGSAAPVASGEPTPKTVPADVPTTRTALALPKLKPGEKNLGAFHLNDEIVRVAPASSPPLAKPPKPTIKEAVDLRAPISASGLSDDGKTYVSAGEKGEIFIGDMDTGKVRGRFWIADNQRAKVAQLSPDGKMFVVENGTSGPELWSDKGLPLAKIPTDEATCAAFSPLGTYLAVGTDDSVTLIRLSDRTVYATLKLRPPVQAIAISADEELVAAGFGTVCVWNVKEDRVQWCQQTAQEVVSALAFSPDGKYLAVGDKSGAGLVQLCDAATGRVVEKHSGSTPVTALAFQSPERLVFANGETKEITVLSVPDMKVTATSPHPGLGTSSPIYDQFILSRNGRRGIFNQGRTSKLAELKPWKGEK